MLPLVSKLKFTFKRLGWPRLTSGWLQDDPGWPRMIPGWLQDDSRMTSWFNTTVQKYNLQVDNQNHKIEVGSIFPIKFANTILLQLPRTCFAVLVFNESFPCTLCKSIYFLGWWRAHIIGDHVRRIYKICWSIHIWIFRYSS